MAISTYKTFLMHKESDTWKKLIDIKDFPDLGGEPEMIETTTLSDGMQTFIPGIKSNDGLEFTHNYTKADYAKLQALEGSEEEYSVWFGGAEEGGVLTPNGSDGKFDFKGYLSVYLTGGDVNSPVEMKSVIAPSTAITNPSGE